MNKKIAFGIKVGLPLRMAEKLAALGTPAHIQDFINKIPINFEEQGETNLSVGEALRQRKAHCLEGAFVAACALWLQGQPPLIMNLRARRDDDHAVALFRKSGYWGAISKSNHVWLRWREAVYLSPRELAMSYFHEYVMGSARTLIAYSAPFDLRRFNVSGWISGTESWNVALSLAKSRHYPLVPKNLIGKLRKRDPIEIRAGKLLDFNAPKKMAKRDINYL